MDITPLIAGSVTLLLAGDEAIVREGIAAFCRLRPEITIVGQCSNGEEALEMIFSQRPDFAILDLNMLKLTGPDLVRKIRMANCPAKLIVLAISRDEKLIGELFRSGADGYVLKDGPAQHLFDAMSFIAEGGQYLTPLLRRGVEAPGSPAVAQLSRRESEVFAFLVDGIRPRDIAKLLDISPKTVDTYRANIMRKLEIEGVAGLVRFAVRHNMTSTSLPC